MITKVRAVLIAAVLAAGMAAPVMATVTTSGAVPQAAAHVQKAPAFFVHS